MATTYWDRTTQTLRYSNNGQPVEGNKPTTSSKIERKKTNEKTKNDLNSKLTNLNAEIAVLTAQLSAYPTSSSLYENIKSQLNALINERDKTIVDLRKAYQNSGVFRYNPDVALPAEFTGPDTYSPYPSTKNKGSGTKNVSMGGAISVLFNAPLISQTNFRGIQAEVLNGNFISAGNYEDALNAFKIDSNTGEVIVGKGAIQSDRYTRNASVAGSFSKPSNYNKLLDDNLYGFKFHYNPQTVSMNWGSLAATDPVYQASAMDPYNPGTSNLTASTIEFSIVLNRIEDFNYLSSSGLTNAFVQNKFSPETGVNTNLKNPYSGFNRLDELKEIYEEGTMYDLKYLFRTMHGQGAYATYKSSLMNQITADPGWLPVRPVELHLGNKLRYRVRVSSLSVNHTIFTPRMVPVLTTVNISCSRYWDDVGGIQ